MARLLGLGQPGAKPRQGQPQESSISKAEALGRFFARLGMEKQLGPPD